MVIQRLVLIFSGLSLCIYGCLVVAATQPSIGEVVSAQGLVAAIDQANQTRSLQRHATIYLHDRIVTQQDSKAQLRLQDDSVIVVQPASEFYVSEFSFSRSAPGNSKYVGNIVKGALINISGQGETKNYRLHSPLTTITFRGTGLATKLISRDTVLINQEIYVFQGYVAVNNRCENVIGSCEPSSISIGVGQQINSAVVNMAGKIQAAQSSGLLEGCGGGLKKIVVKQGGEKKGGRLVVRCK
ncbi:hypothetical protein GAMM_30100 [Gammaproteobacteria bacterium]